MEAEPRERRFSDEQRAAFEAAHEGFMHCVTARLWNGSSERLLLISESAVSLLEPDTSNVTQIWQLRDVKSVDMTGAVVSLTLGRGVWWARNPSVVLPNAERATLLCRQVPRSAQNNQKICCR